MRVGWLQMVSRVPGEHDLSPPWFDLLDLF